MANQIIDGNWVLFNPGVNKFIGLRENTQEYIVVDKLFMAETFVDNIIAKQTLSTLVDNNQLWRNFLVARLWCHINY
jgi:hypothetical protein